ncbi:MAG: protein kinase [Gemmatimonadota bacterium]
MTKCVKCGTEVPPGSRFCTSCGVEVTQPDSATVMIATAEDQQQDPLFLQLKAELAGDYDVERELGRGGMAIVYQAMEIELRRKVALKVLPPGTGGGTMAERFKREARMAAALDHANIIPVYRVGQAAGTYFFAMKFVEGRALDAIIESQGALEIAVILNVMRCATSALAFAHERGIIHRDIKGANILVDRDGRVLVADFGIARAADEKTLTASGSVIGTPHFMSPEQCAGQKLGPQSDQYSLGVFCFQMLTGSVPFDADSLMAILQHHFFTPVPDIRGVREGVPDGLVEVVGRALAKDPSQRYGTTRDMLTAIEAIPFLDAERRESEESLRQLAQGATIPKVRTGSLPPLADTRTLGPGAAGAAPTVTAAPARLARARRSRLPSVAAAGAVVVALGGGAAWWIVRGQAGSTTGPDTAAATTALAGQPTPAAATPTPVESVAAPPADSAPAASAGMVPGVLRLSGVPSGATVRVDGRVVRGSTVERLPGRYRVEVTAEGFEAFAQMVAVRSGETQRLTVAMRAAAQPAGQPAAPQVQPAPSQPQAAPPGPAAAGAAQLRLRTVPPNAQISVNGRAVGVGSLFDFEVPAGVVRLRISAPGYVTLDTVFSVEAGAAVRLGTKTLRSTEGTP